ncbi:MAG: hypothetical protein AB1545_11540 [Thermodesulfobacteriota bacterium]|jgi:hypothetical protein
MWDGTGFSSVSLDGKESLFQFATPSRHNSTVEAPKVKKCKTSLGKVSRRVEAKTTWSRHEQATLNGPGHFLLKIRTIPGNHPHVLHVKNK